MAIRKVIPRSLDSAAASANLSFDANTLYVDSTNNVVGINTATPNSYATGLAVYNAANPSVAIVSGNANAYLRLSSTSDTDMYLSNVGGAMNFVTAGTTKMFLSSAGNVGIGTASPSVKFEVINNIKATSTSATIPSVIVQSQQAAGYVPPQIQLYRIGASNGITPDNQTIGEIRFDGGNAAAGYNNMGMIAVTSGVNATGGAPAVMTFLTSSSGANASERMRIDSSGNVGIGATSVLAGYRMEIDNGSSAGSSNHLAFTTRNTAAQVKRLYIGASGLDGSLPVYTLTTGAAGTDPAIAFAPAGTERMRVSNVGNVGIGTADPIYPLHVSMPLARMYMISSTGTNYVSYSANNTGGGFAFGIDNSGGNNFGMGTAYGRAIFSDGAYPIGIFTNGTERIRVFADGQVGIGTTATIGNAYLNVNQGVVARTAAASSVTPYFQLYNGNATTDLKTWRIGANTNGNFGIETVNDAYSSSTGRLIIDSSGNVGIGFTPQTTGALPKAIELNYGAISTYNGSEFDLSANAYITTNAWTYKTTAAATLFQQSGGQFSFQSAASGTAGTACSFTERAKIDTNGSLFVNAGVVCFTTSQYRSNVASSQLQFINNSAGVSLAVNGTSWGSLSDERDKEIIEPITNAISKVSALRSVIGRYKVDDEDKRRAFLIAQDVKEVLPEAVTELDDENKTLILQYTETIPLLVAAIKEQQALITQLQADVAALQAK